LQKLLNAVDTMFYLPIFDFIYLTKHYIVDINRHTSHKQIVSWPHNKKWQKIKNINITWQDCWQNSYHGHRVTHSSI